MQFNSGIKKNKVQKQKSQFDVKAVSKSTEKLSSGYQVNRAADDAAGLSNSEKMRNQIRGINQSVKNAEDGVSLIQTAEGNMSEIHSILQRMGELATKAANDVNASVDRKAIQDEMGEYLKLYGIEKYISFELGIISNYQYYTGIIFYGYTFGTGEPV